MTLFLNMDKYEKRRQALIKLVEPDKRGNIRKFSERLDIDASYLSRMLYEPGKENKKNIGEDIVEKISAMYPEWLGFPDNVVPIRVLDRINSEDSFEVPIMNAIGSMGIGNALPDDEVVVDVLRLTKSWADKTLTPVTNIKNLVFIHALGESMFPTFNHGDILLVDTGIKTIAYQDRIFVLSAMDRLFIKRVRQTIHGQYEVSSDNPAVKTVDVLNGEHQVEIRGMVVWVWNGKRV